MNNLDNKYEVYSNLFIEVSDDISEDESITNVFISSDTSKENIKNDMIVNNKPISIDQNLNKITINNKNNKNEEILNTTTGMNINNNIDNNLPDFIDNDIDIDSNNALLVNTKDINESSVLCNTLLIKKNKKLLKISNSKQIESDQSIELLELNNKKSDETLIKNVVETVFNNKLDINGWDNDANITAKNWYKLFKQQSFIYQLILDKNIKMGDKLTYISIISSTLLGIFSGFKIWIDNVLFQTVSNILLMLFNFIVALITATSKKYIDDKRNENLRIYIEEVDSFLGEISAQVLKAPIYRMNADEFFKSNNNNYTRLISTAPNLSINEIKHGKTQYMLYITNCDEYI